MTRPDAQYLLDMFDRQPNRIFTVRPPLPESDVEKLKQAGCTVEEYTGEHRIYPTLPAEKTSVIHKFSVHHGAINCLSLPQPCDLLHVGIQRGVVTMWVEVPFTHQKCSRYFQVIGTGQIFPTNTRHIGTVQDGDLVWHVIEHMNVASWETASCKE